MKRTWKDKNPVKNEKTQWLLKRWLEVETVLDKHKLTNEIEYQHLWLQHGNYHFGIPFFMDSRFGDLKWKITNYENHIGWGDIYIRYEVTETHSVDLENKFRIFLDRKNVENIEMAQMIELFVEFTTLGIVTE